jgi:elongation factor Ts
MNKIELIQKLRTLTLAGMSDCKSCLEEANYDLDKSIELIKQRGLAQTARNSSKTASEGSMFVFADPSNKIVLGVELNSQTDFSSKTPEFISLGQDIVSSLSSLPNLQTFSGDLSTIKDKDGRSLEDRRQEVMQKTKENIVLRRWFKEETGEKDNSRVFSYLHGNGRLFSFASIQGHDKTMIETPEFITLGENIAMQIAAMNPTYLSPDLIPDAEKTKQEEIFKAQLKEEGKPEIAWSKILPGKMAKYCSEIALLPMNSVFSEKKTVQQAIDETAKALGNAGSIKVLSFIRAEVGEGIEKEKQADYAEEIGKMTGLKSEKELN